MLDWPEGSIKGNDQKNIRLAWRISEKKHIRLTGTNPDISKDHICKSQLLIPRNNAYVAPVLLILKIWFIFLAFWILNFILLGCGLLWGQSDFPASVLHKKYSKHSEGSGSTNPFCLIWNSWVALKGDLLIVLACCHSCRLHIQCPSVQSARHKCLSKVESQSFQLEKVGM